MKRVVIVCVLGLFVAAGCNPFSVAKRGVTEFRGASGKVVAVRECSPTFCESLGSIRVGTATNGIAPVCPPDVFTLVKGSLADRAASASESLDGTGEAVLDVDITFYNPPGGVLAVAGKSGLLFGRSVVRDGAGQTQGDLLVAVSSEAMRTGREEMADEFSKALIEHIVGEAEGAPEED